MDPNIPQYTERQWAAVMEKWCATQDEALHVYPQAHPVLDAIDDVLMAWGDVEGYHHAVSKFLRLARGQRSGEQ